MRLPETNNNIPVSAPVKGAGDWNAGLYDSKHAFVYKFGEDVVGWLNPQEGERILDLGCGTGHLANQIRSYGAEVIGIDSSAEMVAKAKAAYPDGVFYIKDATDFAFDKKFNAVFSNATLHWVTEAAKAAECVYNSLAPGGRFVLEMGGKNNIKSIADAVKQAMEAEGEGDKLPGAFWYFPSVGEYTTLLEKQGFTVLQVQYFNRETALTGEDGMADWIRMFGNLFFKHISNQQAEKVTARAVAALRSTCYRNNTWYADYVRLRVKAIKSL